MLTDDAGKVRCGAARLSRNKVLTASHCDVRNRAYRHTVAVGADRVTAKSRRHEVVRVFLRAPAAVGRYAVPILDLTVLEFHNPDEAPAPRATVRRARRWSGYSPVATRGWAVWKWRCRNVLCPRPPTCVVDITGDCRSATPFVPATHARRSVGPRCTIAIATLSVLPASARAAWRRRSSSTCDATRLDRRRARCQRNPVPPFAARPIRRVLLPAPLLLVRVAVLLKMCKQTYYRYYPLMLFHRLFNPSV